MTKHLYRVGTSYDNCWQRGTPDGTPRPIRVGRFTTELEYASAIDCADVPPPSPTYVYLCGSDSVFSAGYRFENLQIAKGATIVSAHLEPWLFNGFDPAVAKGLEFRAIVSVQDAGDTNDFAFEPELVRRPRFGEVEWHSTQSDGSGLIYTGGFCTSPDIGPLVQHVVNRPDYPGPGASMVVGAFGEVYPKAEYAEYVRAYGWTASGYDAHDGHAGRLRVEVA